MDELLGAMPQRRVDHFYDNPVTDNTRSFLNGELESRVKTSKLILRYEQPQLRLHRVARLNRIGPDVLVMCIVEDFP